MIRQATSEDLRRIVEMSERFYPHTSYWTKSRIPFNANAVAILAQGLIENSLFHVAENEEGMVIGMIGTIIMPFLFNPDYLHAGEIVWWVEPEYWNSGIGVQLLDINEAAAKEKGVHHLQMIDLPNSPLSARKLYEHRGYELTEQSWTKVL